MTHLFELKDVSLYYRESAVVAGVNLTFSPGRVLCIAGPSGAGKSTLLKTLNRMNDMVPSFRCSGSVLYKDKDIYSKETDPYLLRRRVAMVFQKPCMFPSSIYENTVFGIKHLTKMKKSALMEIAEECLRAANLWEEVKGRLEHPADELSQGQQQRLSIARVLAVDPDVILMDEPTASLDHRSEEAIESLVHGLKKKKGIIVATHKIKQVRRIADDLLLLSGEGGICDNGPVEKVFNSSSRDTREYLSHGDER